MSFFGGYLSPGLTALSTTVGAYQNAQANEAEKAKKDALQQILLQRQQHNDEIANALRAAQTTALTTAKPKRTPTKFTVGGKPVQGTVDEGGHYYDASGAPVSGDVAPFVPPHETPPLPTTTGYVNPKTGAPVVGKDGRPLMPPSAVPTNVFTPGVGEGGAPTIFVGHNKGAPDLQDTGVGKPQTVHIESATNTAAKARLEAAVSEMNNAHAGMAEFEQKLANGQATINGLEQFIGSAGSSFTHDDPASRAIQTATLTALNHTNPELARYIRRALSFAEGESMVSQRPSDFRTKMSAFLSQAASGASPEMVHDIQSRRTSILGPLNNTVIPSQPKGHAPTAGPAAAPSAASSKPSLTERAQQLRQQGLSKEAAKAQLLQEGYDLHGDN